MTAMEIAKALGREVRSVRSRLCAMGITTPPKPWTDEDLAAIREAYKPGALIGEVDGAGLANRLGRSLVTVTRKARELGLTDSKRARLPLGAPRASDPKFATMDEYLAYRSEASRKQIAEHGHPRGALGMKHTPEAKARMSQKSQAFWDGMTRDQRDDLVFKRVKARRDAGIPFANPRGNWKAAWREVGPQRCYFRSRWEANYARYLEWLRSIGEINSWEHEPHTFWFEGIRRGCVSYLPDFRVVNNDGSVQWHEVKGWMDARSKTVLKRMAKYHPKEVLIVIREKQYREIARKVSSLIAGWEA